MELKKVYKQLLDGRQVRDIIIYYDKKNSVAEETIIQDIKDAKGSFGTFALNKALISSKAQKLILDYMNKRNNMQAAISIACFIVNSRECKKLSQDLFKILKETMSIDEVIKEAKEIPDPNSATTPESTEGTSSDASTTTPESSAETSSDASATTPESTEGTSSDASTTTPESSTGTSSDASTTTPESSTGTSSDASTTTPESSAETSSE